MEISRGKQKEKKGKIGNGATSEVLNLTWSNPGLNQRLPSTKPASSRLKILSGSI
jgi:hypothetical protein